MDNNSKKYLRIVFSKGSVYDVPISVVIHHYAKRVVQQIMNKPINDAITTAEVYFSTDPERLIEHANNGMNWYDVLLRVNCINRRNGEDKTSEWISAKKTLVEY